MADNKESAEAPMSEVEKKIRAAFEAFDYEGENTVDARELSTVIYSLDLFPRQSDIHDIIAKVEEDQSGCVHLDKFLPVMTKLLLARKFPPMPEDVLLQAFEVLDIEKKGYLAPKELSEYMTEEGEPFTQEEIDEMLTALTDNEKKVIIYKDILCELTIDTNK